MHWSPRRRRQHAGHRTLGHQRVLPAELADRLSDTRLLGLARPPGASLIGGSFTCGSTLHSRRRDHSLESRGFDAFHGILDVAGCSNVHHAHSGARRGGLSRRR